MATIVLRSIKGSALSFAEADANFSNLNAAIISAENDITTAQADIAAAEADIITAQATADNHIADSSAAHAASAIGVTPTGTIASTDVQAALAELDSDITGISLSQIIQGNSDIEVIDAGTGSIVYTVDAAVQMRNDPGALTFSPSPYRIYGDFSNATIANRCLFTTSVTDGGTNVGITPNGTARTAAVTVFNDATPLNTALFRLLISDVAATLDSSVTGSGSYVPILMATGGSTRLRINTDGAAMYGSAEYDAGNSGTSKTLDFTNGQHQKLTLTDNVSITLSNALPGAAIKIRIVTGSSYTVTFATTVKWAGGTAYTATATTSEDIVTLYYNGTSWYGSFSKGFA